MPLGSNERPSFWRLVSFMMVALKLKESWDNYRRVPTEEGHVALHESTSPIYRDDPEGGLENELPVLVQKYRRKKDCCVCCGVNCGLMWKAIGLAFTILLLWQVARWIVFMFQPTPTGLEDMPVYSTSLGCLDAKHVFGGDTITYTIPVDPNHNEHRSNIRGASGGTIFVTSADPGTTDVKYEMTLRSSDSSLFDEVHVLHPSSEVADDGDITSRFQLSSPRDLSKGCMRYDITLHVPPNLKHLRIESMAATHIKFDPDADLNLDVVSVVMHSTSKDNLLLPTASLKSGNLALEMTRGWLVGNVSIVDRTSLITQRGDAISKVTIFPLPSAGEDHQVATLQTTTGAGRSDFTWIGDMGSPHRRIHSTHRSSRSGDLYLTYSKAEFNGRVDLEAKGYSVTGVHGLGLNRKDDELPWVGERDGGDIVKIRSPMGWVGLYF